MPARIADHNPHPILGKWHEIEEVATGSISRLGHAKDVATVKNWLRFGKHGFLYDPRQGQFDFDLAAFGAVDNGGYFVRVSVTTQIRIVGFGGCGPTGYLTAAQRPSRRVISPGERPWHMAPFFRSRR